MKPILEADRVEQLERALLAIESLIPDELELLDSTPEPNHETEIFRRIYAIAHSATGRCCNHLKGMEMIEECERTGKEMGIYDAEKILGKAEGFAGVLDPLNDFIRRY